MSAKLMGTVWELDLPEHVQPVLLALCDHAKPDGTDCYPSVGRIAWMIGRTDRPVRTVMAWLRERNILVLVRKGGGRGNPARYRIDLDHVPRKPPFVPGKDDVDSRVSGLQPPAVNPAPHSRLSQQPETLLSGELNPAVERSETLLPTAGEPKDEPREEPKEEPPKAPLALFGEVEAIDSDPALWMHETWERELGNGRRLSLTDGRRQKYRAMFTEQLHDAPDPPLAWRVVLRAVKASKHHMGRRTYQMPESLLLNPERRDRWVQEAVELVETTSRKTAAASSFAAAYRARRNGRHG